MLLKPNAHVVLIGLRCSGKSTIGPLLAAELGGGFVDLDALTSDELGTGSTGEALRTLGQEAFRAGELHALVKLLAQRRAPAQRGGRAPTEADPPAPSPAGRLVLALGGGTPTHPPSAEVLTTLREQGEAALIYLRAEVQTLAQRMAATDVALRPALIGGDEGDALAEIGEIFERRDPLYRALASRVIQVDAMAPATAALVISAWLHAHA